MKTILEETARRDLLERLSQIKSETSPKWGKFTATQMVRHLADPMRAAMGEMEVAPKNGPLRNPLLRYLIIYWLPWPKGAPTAPEFIPPLGGDMQVCQHDLKNTLDRFVHFTQENKPAPHPAFGELKREHWGVLTHRHIDHHLRQFGV